MTYMAMHNDKGRQQSNNVHFSIRVVIPVYQVQKATVFREVMPTIQFR
jgi:hypothetical protein